MDLDQAKDLVAGQEAGVSKLRSHLAINHSDNPQRAALADMAMREIEHALARLAALGHHYVVEEFKPGEGEEFPKMMYHSELGEKVVESTSAAKKAVGDGWREMPSVAQTAKPSSLPISPAKG